MRPETNAPTLHLTPRADSDRPPHAPLPQQNHLRHHLRRRFLQHLPPLLPRLRRHQTLLARLGWQRVPGRSEARHRLQQRCERAVLEPRLLRARDGRGSCVRADGDVAERRGDQASSREAGGGSGPDEEGYGAFEAVDEVDAEAIPLQAASAFGHAPLYDA